MASLVVIGSQWGDEGKGKIVDFLANEADLVVRFQGGNNAGHSVKIGEELFALHHVPSGILRPGKLAVIGNGVVIDPGVLIKELEGLESRGVSVRNLRISDRAHVIMPYHRLLDGAEERLRKGAKVGTTGRGIGPSYSDKASRLGIRMNDLTDDDVLREKLAFLVPLKQRILDAYGDPTRLDFEAIHNEYAQYGRRLEQYVTDTGVLVGSAMAKGKKVLFEGAQGTLLDIDHGTYPFVTSSTTVSGNAASGSGISPLDLDDVYGVVKAYTTRVGEGPFPTELSDDTGKRLAEKGGEFGTTTGRARRCGWLDLVVTKYSSRLSGFTGIAMTKIDVLSGFNELKICTHYGYNGKKITTIPSDLRVLQECEPRYKTVDGWDELDETKMKRILSKGFAELPPNMKNYVKFVEKEMGVPVAILGLGRRRHETLDLRKKRWRKR
ncbi:MAG: adenylosuccinate synthase [Thermoplasmatota archaeon]|nr:adenylosuccinate synthase [Candidatus Thermoplasmatota archaeon]MBU1914659.1 adenylosuccinate synthase [Candidatus Thermoplasmatota archaeon]